MIDDYITTAVWFDPHTIKAIMLYLPDVYFFC